jgi:hypothetical protein
MYITLFLINPALFKALHLRNQPICQTNRRIIAPSFGCTSQTHSKVLHLCISCTNRRIIAPSSVCELRFGLSISWSLSHTKPHIIAPSLGCTSHAFHTISWSLAYKSSQHCSVCTSHALVSRVSISWSDSLTYKTSYQCTIIWLHEPCISYHQLVSRVQILAALFRLHESRISLSIIWSDSLTYNVSVHHHLAARATHFIPSVGLSRTNPRIIAPSCCTSHAF